MLHPFLRRCRLRQGGIRQLVSAFLTATGVLVFAPGALAKPGAAHAEPTAPGGKAQCADAVASGDSFVFASADRVLQSYGYVMWRQQPSLVAEPLPYADYVGRRGRLTGRVLQRQGERWLEAVLEDCQRVYAEDASRHSPHAPLRHLELHGRVYFTDSLQRAKRLVGQVVTVKGEGLIPRQRLYTARRDVWYPLEAEQSLRVIGVDTHRYAHAKGIGAFFLKVENAAGQRGLVKFNPRYLQWPDATTQMARAEASGSPQQ